MNIHAIYLNSSAYYMTGYTIHTVQEHNIYICKTMVGAVLFNYVFNLYLLKGHSEFTGINLFRRKERKEMFYLTHSTHFIYG